VRSDRPNLQMNEKYYISIQPFAADTHTLSSVTSMANDISDPFYYLNNFLRVLSWVLERYGDFLCESEKQLTADFVQLPTPSKALLVRMVMRKGQVFRSSKLKYVEIGDTPTAARELVCKNFVDQSPAVDVAQLFGLFTKEELLTIFPDSRQRSGRKSDWLEQLKLEHNEMKPLPEWSAQIEDTLYKLKHAAFYEHLRLLFFGNLHQDWTEFVLADLGIYKYENVAVDRETRAFQQRSEMDEYRLLDQISERLELGEQPDILFACIPDVPLKSLWLERKRAKLLFLLGQACEKIKQTEFALSIYQACTLEEADVRRIRVLEQARQYETALDIAEALWQLPASEETLQQLCRIMPRLQKKLGKAVQQPSPLLAAEAFELKLLQPDSTVELAVCEYLSTAQSPVFYVENALINSLFGLLFWEVIFYPVPGAFFHPFQSGPADLFHKEFYLCRKEGFDKIFSTLETEEYKNIILLNHEIKHGMLSPFVYWDVLTPELVALALNCIPARDLRLLFERLLVNVRSNRSGFPDLIQFFIEENNYRMLEVKGPGDKLQDNQIRWLDYCCKHSVPVAVCYVQWQQAS